MPGDSLLSGVIPDKSKAVAGTPPRPRPVYEVMSRRRHRLHKAIRRVAAPLWPCRPSQQPGVCPCVHTHAAYESPGMPGDSLLSGVIPDKAKAVAGTPPCRCTPAASTFRLATPPSAVRTSPSSRRRACVQSTARVQSTQLHYCCVDGTARHNVRALHRRHVERAPIRAARH